MSWWLSKHYLLVFFSSISMQLLSINHCTWFQTVTKSAECNEFPDMPAACVVYANTKCKICVAPSDFVWRGTAATDTGVCEGCHACLCVCTPIHKPLSKGGQIQSITWLGSGQLNRWHSQWLLMNFPPWQGVSFRPVARKNSDLSKHQEN